MRHLCVSFAVLCYAIIGCDEDPARSVKIITRPPAYTQAKAPRQGISVPTPEWRPNLCPPPPEPSRGSGTFVAKGACNFEHYGSVDCSALGDDFIAGTWRSAAHQSTLNIFINVEGYHGPDKYEYVQILISVSDEKGYFRWRSETMNATVGPGEKFLDMEATRLEPLLTKGAGDIQVVGKLWCRTTAPKN